MKGIILAGGAGTRLKNLTQVVSKQLLPIYDKPMIWYPLATLMEANIRDILIITTPEDSSTFKRIIGTGEQWGVNIYYAEQPKPEGLAQAFLIADKYHFLEMGEPCTLILGDNLFHCAGLSDKMVLASKLSDAGNATIFTYHVSDPMRYGVAEFDNGGKCLSIEEKPEHPKSNEAIVGLYVYPGDVIEKAMQIKPSKRGELEITTLNQMYLNEGMLCVKKLPKGSAWLDTGTYQSLLEASMYVATIQNRQGIEIANIDGIAKNNGWIF